jgi:DNA-binding MarR family transcriptional regulator
MGVRSTKTAYQGRAKQILIRIADSNGNVHTNEVVEMIGIKRPSVCQYLEKLQNEGFITSDRSGNDKRFVYHSITAKGREFLDSLQAGSRFESVKDLTSKSERSAELANRRRIKANFSDLLDDKELEPDLLGNDQKQMGF